MKLKNRILDIYRIQLLLAMIILILNDYLRHLDSPIILCLVGITLLLASFNQVSRPWQKLNWGIQLLVGPFILSHATGSLLVLLSASNVICGFVVLCYLACITENQHQKYSFVLAGSLTKPSYIKQ